MILKTWSRSPVLAGRMINGDVDEDVYNQHGNVTSYKSNSGGNGNIGKGKISEWIIFLYLAGPATTPTDFFIDNHWEKLPQSWHDCLENVDPQCLGDILSQNQTTHVFPLSLLALIKSVEVLSIPRQGCLPKKGANGIISSVMCNNSPKLKNLFLKHVKLKKRHEISLMADVVVDTAVKSGCTSVIDFGSGLGHLVRMLAYRDNLTVAGIECQTQLTEAARKLDLELEYTVKKYHFDEATLKLRRPVHINLNLLRHNQLLQLQLPPGMKEYGLIGLHPCGDLGPLLLKHFVQSEYVKFICVVGCCFMKLTCNGENRGYPMSDFVTNLDSTLSYASREIACHAIETYCERLRKGNYEDLKVHAYRAALERILVGHDPQLRHAPVRSIKHSDTMTFEKYCSLATERLSVQLPSEPAVWAQGRTDVSRWRQVVALYSLRLALAPLVETVILLDRMLYVMERGITCEIQPAFDPKLSPRNHVLIAKR